MNLCGVPATKKGLLLRVALAPLLTLLVLQMAYLTRVAMISVPVVEVRPSAAEEQVPVGDRVSLEGSFTPGEEIDFALGEVLAHTVVGAYHVHTTESDGHGCLDHVTNAAAAAGLDFIVVTDHDVVPPPAQFKNGVLVVPGVELSTSAGHIVAAGATRSARWRLRVEDPSGAARYAGGVSILAHPINLRNPWTGDWADADGMEVVSGDSLFREASARPFQRLLPALLAAPASRTIGWLMMHHRSEEAFEAWDANPHLMGLCAHDAHGHEGYVAHFRVMQLRLALDGPLPSCPDEAVMAVMGALEQGRAWCTLGALANPAGFALMGSRDRVAASLRYDHWPSNAKPRVVLFRDGEEIASGIFEAGVAPAKPGLYRTEVYLDVPWVLGRREFLWIWSSTRRLNPD